MSRIHCDCCGDSLLSTSVFCHKCGAQVSARNSYIDVSEYSVESEKLPESELADIKSRLVARFLDGLFLLGLLLLVRSGLRLALFLTIGYLAFQIIMLHAYGQTVGKKIVHIRVVDNVTGMNGGFRQNVFLREIVNGLMGLTLFYILIDSMFIFSEGRRCLHDRLSGTKVLKEGVESGHSE